MALRGSLQNDPGLARFVVEGTATGKQLGSGSYGSVEEIKVRGLLCAGKRLHEILFDADNVGARNIAEKYLKECQLMSDLRHPNVTQFMGLCFLPNCQLPVLLMEKLDSSMDDLLETVPNISLVLKRSMLEDVAKGLLYLHSHDEQIIHRDLTAKNVLLTSSLVAKITDLGNSRIVSLQPDQIARTLSRLPGTLVYMPPEALSASSRYGPSLDVFSFGHLALFTLTQMFPGDLLESTYPDPNNQDIVLGRTEVERRKRYIDLLEKELRGGEHHPLMLMVKQCLQNAPSRRPTTEELVTELQGMREGIEGPCGAVARADAVRQVVMMKEILGRDCDVREKTTELAAKDEEIQRLQARYEDELHQKDIVIRQKDAQLNEIQQQIIHLQAENVRLEEIQHFKVIDLQHKVNQLQQLDTELRQKDAALQCKDTEIQKLQEQLDLIQKEPELLPVGGSGGHTAQASLSLKWRRVKKMPFPMGSYPAAVVVKGKVYIGGGWAPSDEHKRTVMEYDPYQDEWATLPQYNHTHFGMALLDDHLVLVGGIHVTTKEQSSVLGMLDHGVWKHPFAPMPTARRSPTVATSDNRWLVVIGGKCKDDGTQLSDVEVLDTTSGHWYKCVPLPQPLSHGSAATIDSTCYVVGGYLSGGSLSKKVFSVSLDDLIAQATSPGPAQFSATSAPSHTLWQMLPDIPLTFSTALAVNGALLAVGGEWMWLTNRVIYAYQPANSKRSWVKVGMLPTGRTRCACTVLSSGVVVVAGGSTSIDSSLSQTVDVAELL